MPRPQDRVFTLFGDTLLHRPGPVWTGSLIALLSPLGLSPAATRTVLSRMRRKGWLEAVKRGRKSFYDLSGRGRRLLEEGEKRIYDPPRDEPWDGSWFLVAYSIPEERRSVRDRLRVRLTWLGCGQMGNGLWISPHDIEAEVREVAAELGTRDHVELFRAAHLGFSSDADLVAQCWDLPAVNAAYRRFLAEQEPAFERCKASLAAGSLSPKECFEQRFRLIHEYRAFPFMDPYLPRELLPTDWQGDRGAALFEAYHALLTPPAEAYVDEVLVVANGKKSR